MIVSDKMMNFVLNGSAIRAMFEEGGRMAKEFGKENVYDFSLGNPNTPAPAKIKEAILEILETEDPVLVHGYMNNSGYEDVRQAVADDLNKRFGTDYDAECITMTVGAAGGMNDVLKTLLNPGDEALTFAPFFAEYRSYVGNFDGVLVQVPSKPGTFQPDPEALAEAITERTKVLIINSPNNPTGVIYTEESLREVAKVLLAAQERIGHEIFIFSDEPYRELAYDGKEVPFIPNLYKNTIVGYSFSKSLSLPGERIGYVAIPKDINDFEAVSTAVKTANRILGSVNAPSLMQRVIMHCLDERPDLGFYDRNRKLLYDALTKDGFDVTYPDGAFYLWVRSPEPDEKAFVAKAKAHRILFVSGSGFGCPGYVRIAYCVSPEMIKRSLPSFEALAKDYGLL